MSLSEKVVVPGAASPANRKLVIAVDSSPLCGDLVSWVMAKLIKPSTDLVILATVLDMSHIKSDSVFQIEGITFTTSSGKKMELKDLIQDTERQADVHAMELLRKYSDQLTQHGVNVRAVVLHGKPRDALVRYADEVSPDALIMGRRNLNSLQRLSIGSVSDYVLHHANCPVIIFNKPTLSDALINEWQRLMAGVESINVADLAERLPENTRNLELLLIKCLKRDIDRATSLQIIDYLVLQGVLDKETLGAELLPVFVQLLATDDVQIPIALKREIVYVALNLMSKCMPNKKLVMAQRGPLGKVIFKTEDWELASVVLEMVIRVLPLRDDARKKEFINNMLETAPQAVISKLTNLLSVFDGADFHLKRREFMLEMTRDNYSTGRRPVVLEAQVLEKEGDSYERPEKLLVIFSSTSVILVSVEEDGSEAQSEIPFNRIQAWSCRILPTVGLQWQVHATDIKFSSGEYKFVNLKVTFEEQAEQCREMIENLMRQSNVARSRTSVSVMSINVSKAAYDEVAEMQISQSTNEDDVIKQPVRKMLTENNPPSSEHRPTLLPALSEHGKTSSESIAVPNLTSVYDRDDDYVPSTEKKREHAQQTYSTKSKTPGAAEKLKYRPYSAEKAKKEESSTNARSSASGTARQRASRLKRRSAGDALRRVTEVAEEDEPAEAEDDAYELKKVKRPAKKRKPKRKSDGDALTEKWKRPWAAYDPDGDYEVDTMEVLKPKSRRKKANIEDDDYAPPMDVTRSAAAPAPKSSSSSARKRPRDEPKVETRATRHNKRKVSNVEEEPTKVVESGLEREPSPELPVQKAVIPITEEFADIEIVDEKKPVTDDLPTLEPFEFKLPTIETMALAPVAGERKKLEEEHQPKQSDIDALFDIAGLSEMRQPTAKPAQASAALPLLDPFGDLSKFNAAETSAGLQREATTGISAFDALPRLNRVPPTRTHLTGHNGTKQAIVEAFTRVGQAVTTYFAEQSQQLMTMQEREARTIEQQTMSALQAVVARTEQNLQKVQDYVKSTYGAHQENTRKRLQEHVALGDQAMSLLNFI